MSSLIKPALQASRAVAGMFYRPNRPLRHDVQQFLAAASTDAPCRRP
jgi:hypothetical protein